MTTRTLSQPAHECIAAYLALTIGHASSQVLYFNNKTLGTRAALAVYVGKGTPQDISHELVTILFKKKVAVENLTTEHLRRLMVEYHIGIDCSGFAYHVLNSESIARHHGRLSSHLSFNKRKGLFAKIATRMHPEKNASVAVFADNANSSMIDIRNIVPGDIITMIGHTTAPDRDHILIVHAVDYDEASAPIKIHYSHSVAYPEDGQYNTGVRQGKIDLSPGNTSLLDGLWTEKSTLLKAQSSRTELRRLNWK